MTADRNRNIDGLADALREWALGPDWRRTATAGSLQAVGGINKADDWWETDASALRRKDGYNAITVHNDGGWAATVLASPSGKAVTVAVPYGTKVVVVEDVES